ncbi:MAG: two-component regulator propeller domain-containing protein [Bacteroidales bacterium]
MNLFRYALTCLLTLTGVLQLFAQSVPIGQWRDELPYTLVNSVTDAGSKIYASTPYAVFYFDKEDNSVVRITKINGLSDIGISTIRYNKEYQTLVIAYSNANIDLIKNNTIINISDIKRKPILGNKTINDIYFIGKNAYLSCGFGIVVLDISREEILDTYYIGKDGSQVNVLALTKDGNDSLFAASEKGIYKAYAKDVNLTNFAAWHKDARMDTTAKYNTITYFSGKVFVNKKQGSEVADTMYTFSNGSWSRWEPEFFNPVMHLQSTDNYLVVSYNYFVTVYNPSLEVFTKIYSYFPGSPYPQDAIADRDGLFWVGDTYSGLLSFEPITGSVTRLNLSGPSTALAFSMTCWGNDLYIAPGGRDASFIPIWIAPQVYHFNNTNWNNIAGYNNPVMNQAHDVVNIAVDPFDSKHVFAASFGRGLLELYNDSVVKRYNESNSTLGHHTSSDTSDIRVGGIAFDAAGNLWAVTCHNNNCLSMKKGAQWTGFNIPIVNESDLGQILIDKNGQKWIQMRYGNTNPNSIMVFTDNGTPENPSDDKSALLNSAVGSGNIPGTTVLTMAEDKKGEIWIGTEQGVAVFYSPENVFQPGQNFDAQRILVTQGSNVQYLLENETVTAIAVDGANQKWIGTDRGGVFLFSEDGTKQIYHFTAENSPLLSDRITSIAINNDGEVFYGTDKGVISFRAPATPGGDTNENVYAFPNPVKSDYEGYIAVKGLVSNAQVRITDINGVLVYSTRAEGGQAVWDGKNFDGKKARTGVYLVYAANDSGAEKVVTKILIIN